MTVRCPPLNPSFGPHGANWETKRQLWVLCCNHPPIGAFDQERTFNQMPRELEPIDNLETRGDSHIPAIRPVALRPGLSNAAGPARRPMTGMLCRSSGVAGRYTDLGANGRDRTRLSHLTHPITTPLGNTDSADVSPAQKTPSAPRSGRGPEPALPSPRARRCG